MQGSILSRLYNAHRHTAGREELEKVAEIFVRTFMEKIATRYTMPLTACLYRIEISLSAACIAFFSFCRSRW